MRAGMRSCSRGLATEDASQADAHPVRQPVPRAVRARRPGCARADRARARVHPGRCGHAAPVPDRRTRSRRWRTATRDAPDLARNRCCRGMVGAPVSVRRAGVRRAGRCRHQLRTRGTDRIQRRPGDGDLHRPGANGDHGGNARRESRARRHRVIDHRDRPLQPDRHGAARAAWRALHLDGSVFCGDRFGRGLYDAPDSGVSNYPRRGPASGGPLAVAQCGGPVCDGAVRQLAAIRWRVDGMREHARARLATRRPRAHRIARRGGG